MRINHLYRGDTDNARGLHDPGKAPPGRVVAPVDRQCVRQGVDSSALTTSRLRAAAALPACWDNDGAGNERLGEGIIILPVTLTTLGGLVHSRHELLAHHQLIHVALLTFNM